MAIPADFKVLWQNLPQWFNVRETIGNIPKGWETCCIQMSHAMNMSGLPIRYHNKKRVHMFQGRQHLLDVGEMRVYLNDKYQRAEVIGRVDASNKVLPRIAVQGAIGGRQGIIAFGGRHIDLWDGWRIHGENYIQSALWEAKSAISEGIFFWDVEAPGNA